jgi:IS30 family transposase
MPAYSHLSDEERDLIAVLKAAGHSLGTIAAAVRRAKSTISRELRRNALPSGRYSPLHAAGAYQLRRRREAILEKDQKLRTFVQDRLAEGWAPEQISGWLRAGHECGLRSIGFEAIYAFIYRASRKGEELWRYLTRGHKRRKPRRARPSRDTIKDRASIHDRPKEIETRDDVGSWFCEKVSLDARCPAIWKNGRGNHFGHTRRFRAYQSCSAEIRDLRQRYGFGPAWFASIQAGHDASLI